MAAPSDSSFHVAIPQVVIDRIITRVRRAHWPDKLVTERIVSA
jgi:hypothetical protein